MRAYVLCGGKGTRLRPYTYSIPKPMLPLGDKPLLEFVVNNLRKNGITDLVLTVGYLRERIQEYFGDGKKFGVKIRYIVEQEEMNTAGSISPDKKNIDDTFVVVMGDHLTNINLKKMIDFHRRHNGIATLGLKKQGIPLDYGVAELDKEGRIVGFKEKPILQNLINSAIYVFEPEIKDYLEPGLDFAMDVFPRLLKQGKKIYGYPFEEYWMDVGHLQDYENINKLISLVDMAVAHKD